MVIQEPPGKLSSEKPTNTDVDWLRSAPRITVLGVGLFAFGLLGMLVFSNVLFGLITWIGSILLIVAALQYYPRILAREEVVDRWDQMIEGADGRGDEIVANAKKLLGESRAPNILMEHQDISPGLLRGLLGSARPFLIITNSMNSNLKPYKMYVNTRDYGLSLQVSWYLVKQPGWGEKIIKLLLIIPVVGLVVLPLFYLWRLSIGKQAGFLNLDLFDEQDLRAYVTTAHHSILQAVEDLMKERHIDTSRLNRHSRGFLGIV